MQKLVLSCFVALCGSLMLNACACGPGPVEDAGPDAGGGGEGEGEGEGEPQPGVVGDSCDPVDVDACETGLVCAPGQLGLGVCRVSCAEDESSCPSGTACQSIIDFQAEVIVPACAAPQSVRDQTCLAWNDPDACAEDMECLNALTQEDEAGNVTRNFHCKVTCDPDAENADDQCPTGESCVEGTTFQDFQVPADPQESFVECDPEACDAGDAACACTEGFKCHGATLTDGTSVDICAYVAGQCSTLVPPILPEHIVPGGITPDLQCNEVTRHAACDDTGIGDEGATFCVRLPGGFDGICFPFCGQLAADYDGDGAIGEGEENEIVSCAEGWECAPDTGIAIGVGAAKTDANGNDVVCDISNCTDGEPCPSECGEGEYHCVEGFADDPICFAPLLACIPEEGVDPTDAGPDAGDDTDAGDDETDAGGDDVDAGVDAGGDDETDAGNGVDGGDGVVDAGTDAGSDEDDEDAGTTEDAGSEDAGDSGPN